MNNFQIHSDQIILNDNLISFFHFMLSGFSMLISNAAQVVITAIIDTSLKGDMEIYIDN